MSGKERDGGGGGWQLRACRSTPFSAGWTAQRLVRIRSCLKALHFPRCPGQCQEALVRWFIAPTKMEMVWKFSLAALKQLGAVTAEKRELLVFPAPQGVRSGAACQGLERSSHPPDGVMGHPPWAWRSSKADSEPGELTSPGERGTRGTSNW